MKAFLKALCDCSSMVCGRISPIWRAAVGSELRQSGLVTVSNGIDVCIFEEGVVRSWYYHSYVLGWQFL